MGIVCSEEPTKNYSPQYFEALETLLIDLTFSCSSNPAEKQQRPVLLVLPVTNLKCLLGTGHVGDQPVLEVFAGVAPNNMQTKTATG